MRAPDFMWPSRQSPATSSTPSSTYDPWRNRILATDFIRQRGTSKQPDPPRDLVAQSAPRGVLVTWGLPPGDASDIAGWRVYSPDENSLVGRIPDRGTRIFTVPSTAGSTPPTINVFISAVNSLGVESAKILTTGKATAEAGAPSQPTTPPGFSSGTGSDTSGGIGNIDISSGQGIRTR